MKPDVKKEFKSEDNAPLSIQETDNHIPEFFVPNSEQQGKSILQKRIFTDTSIFAGE